MSRPGASVSGSGAPARTVLPEGGQSRACSRGPSANIVIAAHVEGRQVDAHGFAFRPRQRRQLAGLNAAANGRLADVKKARRGGHVADSRGQASLDVVETDT